MAQCGSVSRDGQTCRRQAGHVNAFNKQARIHADRKSTGNNWWDEKNTANDDRMTEADYETWDRL